MKRLIKLFSGIFVCCLLFTITSLASEDMEWEQKMSSISVERESVLLPGGVNLSASYDYGTRGRYLSSYSLGITNEGYGTIGIYANILAHVPVKKIRMNVYLDRWDENSEEWVQVDGYKFAYEYEEGGEDLTAATEMFSVNGFPTGCYYRLRGICAVYPFEGGLESQGPITDGVLITNGPV